MGSVDFTELAAYRSRLRVAAFDIDRALKGAVRQATKDIEREAIRTVPRRVGPHTHDGLRDKPGHLWQHIRSAPVDTSSDGVASEVTADKFYAGYLEYGTRRIAARRYMSKAVKKQIRPLQNKARSVAAKLVVPR